MIKNSTKFIRNPEIIYKKIDNKIIILDQNNSKIRELNETAVLIWENSEKPTSVNEICEILINHYDIKKNHALTDIAKFVSLYLEDGLLKLI